MSKHTNYNLPTSEDVEQQILAKYLNGDRTRDKSGVMTVDIRPVTFRVTKDTLIRPSIPRNYIERELEWYESMSRSVYDIPGQVPKIWIEVADENGMINSNYGWCCYSPENGSNSMSQFDHVVAALKKDPVSRQAIFIYNRPSMHTDATANGMHDFMCMQNNVMWVDDGKLFVHAHIRSQDIIFGFPSDLAHVKHLQAKVADSLDGVAIGDIIWTASSLHIYERHFKMLEEFSEAL